MDSKYMQAVFWMVVGVLLLAYTNRRRRRKMML